MMLFPAFKIEPTWICSKKLCWGAERRDNQPNVKRDLRKLCKDRLWIVGKENARWNQKRRRRDLFIYVYLQTYLFTALLKILQDTPNRINGDILIVWRRQHHIFGTNCNFDCYANYNKERSNIIYQWLSTFISTRSTFFK